MPIPENSFPDTILRHHAQQASSIWVERIGKVVFRPAVS